MVNIALAGDFLITNYYPDIVLVDLFPFFSHHLITNGVLVLVYCFMESTTNNHAVADPGFARREAPIPRGTPVYHLANFPEKMHENDPFLHQLGGYVKRILLETPKNQ